MSTSRVDAIADLWRWFAEHEAGTYSPLYAAIATHVATDRRLLQRVIDDVPPDNHLPLALFAAAHDLVLADPAEPLGVTYLSRDRQAAPQQFVATVNARWDDITATLHRRHVQTNECGRSAPIALTLAMIDAAIGPIDVLIDAGASAGLNLLYDRYHLDYAEAGTLGDPTSPVHATCELTGPDRPMPATAPDIPVRLGIDREPLDATDHDDCRWLLACTWPDGGRLGRTSQALQIAAADPPDLRRGDLVDDLASITATTGQADRVCVLTSWAAGYLDPATRARLGDTLSDISTHCDVVWLALEHRGVVDVATPASLSRAGFSVEPSIVTVTHYRHRHTHNGRAVALVHPHGTRFRWL